MKTVPDWLSHLQRDRRGLPCPYINRYGGENVNLLRIAPDRHAGGRPSIFMDDNPEEPIDFTKQHHGRQRECMAQGLCQVCHRTVPWSRRFLVLGQETLHTIELYGQSKVVTNEPWLCERCCRFAVTVCPALIRRTRAEEMHVLRVTSQRDVTLICSSGYVDGPLREESLRVQPVFWLKLALSEAAWARAVPASQMAASA